MKQLSIDVLLFVLKQDQMFVLILLIVASMTSAVLAVFAYIGKEREYMKRLLLEDKLAATLKDKRRLEKEIDVNKKAKEEAERRVKEIETKAEKLSLQMGKEKDKTKVLLLNLASRKEEVIKLKDNLDKEEKEKLAISKKLEELQIDYDTARRNITKLKSEKIRLEKDLSQLKESSVKLDKIVVKPTQTTAVSETLASPKGLLRGRVLVVNRDYSFIVVDLGKNDGIKKGIVFEVRDGTDFLGKAEVDKIYDTMSSATLLPGSSIDNIKKGNIVIESH